MKKYEISFHMKNISEMDRKILIALQADATETLKALADR